MNIREVVKYYCTVCHVNQCSQWPVHIFALIFSQSNVGAGTAKIVSEGERGTSNMLD